MQTLDLIGKPWAIPCDPPHSYDCWELAVEVRNRMGLFTPTYDIPPMIRKLAHQSDFGTPDPALWHPMPEPTEGCLVGFGRPAIKHCGVYLNEYVIHSHSADGVVGAVMMTRLRSMGLVYGQPSFWEPEYAIN